MNSNSGCYLPALIYSILNYIFSKAVKANDTAGMFDMLLENFTLQTLEAAAVPSGSIARVCAGRRGENGNALKMRGAG